MPAAAHSGFTVPRAQALCQHVPSTARHLAVTRLETLLLQQGHRREPHWGLRQRQLRPRCLQGHSGLSRLCSHCGQAAQERQYALTEPQHRQDGRPAAKGEASRALGASQTGGEGARLGLRPHLCPSEQELFRPRTHRQERHHVPIRTLSWGFHKRRAPRNEHRRSVHVCQV